MGSIKNAYIFPHPPIIVPEVGGGKEREAIETMKAAERASEQIKKDTPDTIILTSPHAPMFSDYIYISFKERLNGDFGSFGSPDTKLAFDNNTELAEKISKIAGSRGIYAGGLADSIAKKYKVSMSLDHGALVPLYYVNKVYSSFKLVHIAVSGLPFIDLYRFGMCIREAVEQSKSNAIFLASGDLSHRLSKESPYGMSKSGKEFDELFVESVKTNNVEKLLGLKEEFCEEAAECGLRSFLMMYGALDGFDLKPEVYSYEGPFGIGYSIARIGVEGHNKNRELLGKIKEKSRIEMEGIRQGEDPFVKLARNSLESFVKDEKVIAIPEGLPEEMVSRKAGVFVSIKKQGQLRGCIGTTGPTRKNIAEEIIYNTISSGTRDPRFEPVEEDELDGLVYSVDVLDEPEPIKSMDELDVIRYGVIVRSGARSGLLLPNLEGVDTPEKQVSISLQKAGIRPNEKYEMERFEVIRHK